MISVINLNFIPIVVYKIKEENRNVYKQGRYLRHLRSGEDTDISYLHLHSGVLISWFTV